MAEIQIEFSAFESSTPTFPKLTWRIYNHVLFLETFVKDDFVDLIHRDGSGWNFDRIDESMREIFAVEPRVLEKRRHPEIYGTMLTWVFDIIKESSDVDIPSMERGKIVA